MSLIRRISVSCAVVVVLLALDPTPARAFQIRRDAVAASGGSAAGTVLRLRDTIGLPVAGRAETPANWVLWAGFWVPRADPVSAVDDHVDPDSDGRSPEEPAPPGPALPAVTRLVGVFPNPLTRVAEIRFDVAPPASESAITRLDLYDVHGRRVGTPLKGVVAPGTYRMRWDAGPGAGHGTLPSGVYFLRFISGGHRETLRLVKTR